MALEIQLLGAEWDSRWDALAGSRKEAGFMQSSVWANFKRVEGFEALRLGLFEQGELCGGGTLYFYPAETGSGFLVCPEGPILDWEDTPKAREGLRLILGVAQELAEKQGALGLRIEPHLSKPKPSVLRNWTRSPIDLTPCQTLYIDLALSESEILAQMHPKGRYNLKLAQRHGVVITESSEIEALTKFYPLFQETATRNGFFGEPYGFFLNLCTSLLPSDFATFLFAEWEGRLLGTILALFYGRRATYLYGGSSDLDRHVMPNYLLHWRAMQLARERGCVEYDLFGFEPFGVPDHLYAGFSRFKKQFGGAYVETIGSMDNIFYDLLADRLVTEFQQHS